MIANIVLRITHAYSQGLNICKSSAFMFVFLFDLPIFAIIYIIKKDSL